ncbi:hypothetical protein B1L07_00355 [Stenotrophomonas acidaminiphila]|nr:hypothetical protein B1L07_00355 [Stenotrophomonas acidaminiphila]
MRMSAFRPLLFVVALACPTPSPASAATPPSVVPLPARMDMQPGRYRPGATLRIATQGDPARVDALRVLAGDILRAAWQRPLDTAGSRAPADLTLTLDADAGANPEGYTLRVDERGIRLRAAGDAGLFHGLQTLRQLLADGGDGIAHVAIDDAPRFAWRGLHLDVARHLFPMDYIKRQLDLMARYKFNVLHWHLTDDQGWRLEIKRYPKLTEVGAWRAQTALHRRDGRIAYDGTRYGGSTPRPRRVRSWSTRAGCTSPWCRRSRCPAIPSRCRPPTRSWPVRRGRSRCGWTGAWTTTWSVPARRPSRSSRTCSTR